MNSKSQLQNSKILTPFFNSKTQKLEISEMNFNIDSYNILALYGGKGKGKSTLLNNIYLNRDLYLNNKSISFLSNKERIINFDNQVFSCLDNVLAIKTNYNKSAIHLLQEISDLFSKTISSLNFFKKNDVKLEFYTPNNSSELLYFLHSVFSHIGISPFILLKNYDNLSVGERNIINILALCFNDSKIILFDEVFNSIDYIILEKLIPIVVNILLSVGKKLIFTVHKIEVLELFQYKQHIQYIYFNYSQFNYFSNFYDFINNYKLSMKEYFVNEYDDVLYIINRILKK